MKQDRGNTFMQRVYSLSDIRRAAAEKANSMDWPGPRTNTGDAPTSVNSILRPSPPWRVSSSRIPPNPALLSSSCSL